MANIRTASAQPRRIWPRRLLNLAEIVSLLVLIALILLWGFAVDRALPNPGLIWSGRCQVLAYSDRIWVHSSRQSFSWWAQLLATGAVSTIPPTPSYGFDAGGIQFYYFPASSVMPRSWWTLIMPIYYLFALAGIAPAIWLWLFLRRQRDPALCAECKYNLTGNLTGTCPECGTPLSDRNRQHLRQRAEP